MQPNWIKPFFLVAAAYDVILGAAFLVAGGPIYDAFEVTRPNHMGYVHWGAAVVFIFGVGFYRVACDPVRNFDIIRLGVLFKLAYAGTVLGHHFLGGGVPMMWLPWAVFDLVFLVMFLVAMNALSQPAPASS